MSPGTSKSCTLGRVEVELWSPIFLRKIVTMGTCNELMFIWHLACAKYMLYIPYLV